MQTWGDPGHPPGIYIEVKHPIKTLELNDNQREGHPNQEVIRGNTSKSRSQPPGIHPNQGVFPGKSSKSRSQPPGIHPNHRVNPRHPSKSNSQHSEYIQIKELAPAHLSKSQSQPQGIHSNREVSSRSSIEINELAAGHPQASTRHWSVNTFCAMDLLLKNKTPWYKHELKQLSEQWESKLLIYKRITNYK